MIRRIFDIMSLYKFYWQFRISITLYWCSCIIDHSLCNYITSLHSDVSLYFLETKAIIIIIINIIDVHVFIYMLSSSVEVCPRHEWTWVNNGVTPGGWERVTSRPGTFGVRSLLPPLPLSHPERTRSNQEEYYFTGPFLNFIVPYAGSWWNQNTL